jgi:hypothetical protein
MRGRQARRLRGWRVSSEVSAWCGIAGHTRRQPFAVYTRRLYADDLAICHQAVLARRIGYGGGAPREVPVEQTGSAFRCAMSTLEARARREANLDAGKRKVSPHGSNPASPCSRSPCGACEGEPACSSPAPVDETLQSCVWLRDVCGRVTRRSQSARMAHSTRSERPFQPRYARGRTYAARGTIRTCIQRIGERSRRPVDAFPGVCTRADLLAQELLSGHL